MFDAHLRPWIDPPLDAAAARAVAAGLTADAVTMTGLGVGLIGAAAVALGAPLLGLFLLACTRLADGLDGAIARRTILTDRGGFLDIVADFAIYAAYPLAFAVTDPAANALAAASLLASIIVSGTAFLAFAAIAAKRGMSTAAQGEKTIYYLAGLAEGAETIAAFAAMCVWPQAFAGIAWAFAAVCGLTGAARVVHALAVLR